MDWKQTASSVAVNEVEVDVVEANATGPAAGILRRAFFLTTLYLSYFLKNPAVRIKIKIVIVALVIGLVWGGGRGDSDKPDSKESTPPPLITASEEQ